MKRVVGLGVLLGLLSMSCLAQEPIFRCGNEYTNAKPDPRRRDCKLVAGGNVTVVQGPRLARASEAKASPSAPAPRIDSAEQRARDSDARLILQSELKKAQARQQELEKEYNQGQPEKSAEETRNPQKYLDRVAELKASLARNESDMAGIRRELERLPGGAAASTAR